MTSREVSPEASRSSRASSAAPGDATPGGNFESSMIEPGSGHGTKRGKSKATAPASATATSGGGPFSGTGKIRHLKKEDGEPLWRRDIQYDFLRAVFDDDTKVFTNNYEKGKNQKQNFADLYIDTMARSSKTSKVLRDKLLSDREAAKSMAMVCLLVNVGRMNTTLNCIVSLLVALLKLLAFCSLRRRFPSMLTVLKLLVFPEMRAQLRTYHAIPSLQAHQDASAYKQLQDAPRLKSILKGAAEDLPEPRDLGEFKTKEPPRTNPVNLIFLLCQQASHVAELHFPTGLEFHDLVMKTKYSSKSRARGFLWLMWFYLESDFTEEGCEENPFGAGVDYGTDVANQGIPRLEELSPDEQALENIDPQEELDFGREKQSHRAKIIAADQAYMADHQTKRGSRGRLMAEEGPTAAILPRIRPSKHESDLDSTRSTPPPRALARIGANNTGRRSGAGLKYQIFEGSSPAGGSPHVVDGILPRKPRPPTAHQLAVERNRSQRVEHILDRGLRREHHKARRIRRQEGIVMRAKRRLDAMGDPFADSDDEEYRMFASDKMQPAFRDKGFGGLCQLSLEDDDFGEEFSSYAASLRRANRRLVRWLNRPEAGVVQPVKRRTVDRLSDDATPDKQTESEGKGGAENGEAAKSKLNGNANGDVPMEDADDLDDISKELLGIGSGGEDEELDDVDKTLLGLDDGSDGNDS
ncbi:hypothetical protein DL766_000938 [Monosporascus sp. MC13-8B]|uniref:INO80 chromatin remodeling complex Ies1 n=1 Tax=Monosporascus cannonballus TaxID=155416 RepID=A0ABY0H0U8_9PEZI|nr:hypothetical protein DL762_007926 [Monosporascus cannonballus]RYP00733.1 hypothetical protein DL763_000613 [Monosporascus cannonballus]RYP38521.1 hypothetical protein DL766_000938 [Monosporascus sp. MC13-8B]